MTNLDRVTLLLIGKALDGTESVPVLGPRFQHHPPKIGIVELLQLDGLVEHLYQASVKLLVLKHVLVGIVVIAIGVPLSRSKIAKITYCIIFQTL